MSRREKKRSRGQRNPRFRQEEAKVGRSRRWAEVPKGRKERRERKTRGAEDGGEGDGRRRRDRRRGEATQIHYDRVDSRNNRKKKQKERH